MKRIENLALLSIGMKITFLFTVLLFSSVGHAQDINETFAKANQAYANKDYNAAKVLYTDIKGTNDPKVYYNLANCYYRLEDYANAILYYEKSIKWGGNYKDNSYNLQLSREFLRDELKSKPELVVWQYWKRIASRSSANLWSIFALILLSLGVALLLVSSKLKKRTLVINLSFVLFGGALFLYALGITRHFQESRSSHAILMPASVAVKSEPSASSSDLFIIHSGIKLGLKREENQWTEVTLPDGKKGWIKSEYLEKI